MHTLSWADLGRALFLAFGLLALTGLARADRIIFKDGFVLIGKVGQGSETIVDNNQPITIPKGPFFIDDGARRMTFSFQLVEDAVQKDAFQNAELVRVERRISRLLAQPMPPLIDIRDVGNWNDRWERVYQIGTFTKGRRYRYDIQQRMTLMTPQYLRMDALKYDWNAYYLTRELTPDTLRNLLYNHPDLKLKGDKLDGSRRLRVYRFFTQAGMYDAAEAELEDLLRDAPDDAERKKSVEDARERLKEIRAIDLIDALERAERGGRHDWALEHLADFPRAAVPNQLMRPVREMEARYDVSKEGLKHARVYLKDLPNRLGVPGQKKLFEDATETILAELTHDNVDRLEEFLKLARQAELDRGQQRTPNNSPIQLLSAAVTGWVLGKRSTETRFEFAEHLWLTRRFVLAYARETDPTDRHKLLESYQRSKEALPPDVMAQLVSLLPPPQPEKEITAEPFETTTDLPWGPKKGVSYLLQLPPEYHHGRPSPVLIALAHAGEKPREMLDRVTKQAAENGYVLAVPNWGEDSPSYGFSDDEYEIVRLVLRDLQRRCNVDCDRVFLMGYNEGGTMALDVGLSHPGMFAGVVAVSPTPRMFIERYVNNAQYLPTYVVFGGQAGGHAVMVDKLFKKWIPNGDPALSVEYKGRGLEWFPAEMPIVFDWMSRKRRTAAFPTLGRREFQTSRPSDNRFYWVTTDVIHDAYLNDPRAWRNTVGVASVQARIGEGNQINLTTKGLGQASVWLGRDALGQSMVDFSKPVTVRINGTSFLNEVVKPSLETLLEDYYQRGDRQHLYLARRDFTIR